MIASLKARIDTLGLLVRVMYSLAHEKTTLVPSPGDLLPGKRYVLQSGSRAL